MKLEEGVPLARMTTVGIGGPARALARPRTLAELEDALAWADEQRRGRAADRARLQPAGGRLRGGRARRPARGRARGGRDAGHLLVAGGGAPNAVCLHRARGAGLGGFEFACAIPGTAGGGVRMNAGAYGCDWKAILVRALVVDARAARWRTAAELELSLPPLGARSRAGRRAGRVPARRPRRRRDQGNSRRHAGPQEGDAADQQADVRKRVQEPRPRAGGRTDDRALRPEGTPHRRRDRLAPPRQLHRERRRCDGRRGDRADDGGARTRARPVRGRARARGRASRRARAATGWHAARR